MPDKKNSKNITEKKIQTSSLHSNEKYDESIDFFDLIRNIWIKKWIFIVTTFVFSSLSFVFAKNQIDIFKVETILIAPKYNFIHQLSPNMKSNILEAEQDMDKTKVHKKIFFDLYTIFRRNLLSRKIQSKFIKKYNLGKIFSNQSDEEKMAIESTEAFSSMLITNTDSFLSNIIVDNKHDSGFSISIEHQNPQLMSKILNDYIEFVNLETILVQKEIAQKIISNQIIDIEYTISSKRSMAKQRREDQILRFQEARAIAKNLGFERRVNATNIIQNTSKTNADISSATTPLYYIGTEALSAEISILKNRTSDDPFIQGLRDLQETLTYLKSINLDSEELSAVTVDRKAYPSLNPVRPNRRLIVSIGIFSGLFLGLLLTIIIISYQNYIKNFI